MKLANMVAAAASSFSFAEIGNWHTAADAEKNVFILFKKGLLKAGSLTSAECSQGDSKEAAAAVAGKPSVMINVCSFRECVSFN